MAKKRAFEPIEVASRDEISALQLQRLRWSLQHAYDNVPHYRKKFDERGVHPADLKDLKDLARFPFTTKADLRDNYPYGLFATPMRQVVRVHASSGTTGKPTVVGYTQKDVDTWSTIMARSIHAAGGGPDDILMVSYGYGLFTGGLGAHYGAEKLGCAVIPMGGGQTEKQVQLINDFKPTVVMVTPSYMLVIAEEMERQGFAPRESSVRLGIHGAEPWTNEIRGAIEERWDCDAIDIYGLSEVMGPGVAQECLETKDGLTIWEDHFYPEVIDPESGELLPDGELGELVFTSLSKEAMPVIRYRTRDLTRLLPGTARSMRRMAKLTGRSDDMLIIRGVNVFPSQVEELVMRQPELDSIYQIVLDKDGPLDRMSVNVEFRPAHLNASPAEQHRVAGELHHAIKSYVGVSAHVNVLHSGGVERTVVGKAKRVVDRRPK